MLDKPINYFQEYSDYIDELQNQILRIQLKYNSCQSAISTEFKKGFIAPEVAEKMLAVKINQYVPSTDRAYRLDKSEVDFIREYADLDSNGEIKATILKPKYFKKKALLDQILESVKTFSYFDNLDDTSKRMKLYDNLTSSIKTKIKELQGKLASYTRQNGENAKNTAIYAQLQSEISKCQKGIENFNQIKDCDEETLLRIISSYYKVDYSYYEWYLNMQLKSIYDNGNLSSEHIQTTESLITNVNDVKEIKNRIDILNKTINSKTRLLFNFLTEQPNISIDQNVSENNILSYFRKNKEKNNRDNLYEIFIKYSSLPSFLEYLQATFFKSKEKSMNLTTCFDMYLLSNYGEDTTYVDEEIFKKDLVNNTTRYFKEIIESNQKKLTHQLQLLEGTISLTTNKAEETHTQAILQDKASTIGTSESSTFKIEGLTEEELTKVFESLNNILDNQYNFNNTKKILTRKRG